MLQHGEPAHPVPGELTAGVPADVRARGDHLGRVPHPDRVLALGQTAVSGQDPIPGQSSHQTWPPHSKMAIRIITLDLITSGLDFHVLFVQFRSRPCSPDF